MCCIFFFFKQKTAYEMRISDWSSDVCSSDLVPLLVYPAPEAHGPPLPEGGGDNAQARLHPAGDDVHHLRTYRRGDARRAIAWKPSARHGALLVREYEQPLGADIVLGCHALPARAWEELGNATGRERACEAGWIAGGA